MDFKVLRSVTKQMSWVIVVEMMEKMKKQSWEYTKSQNTFCMCQQQRKGEVNTYVCLVSFDIPAHG